MAFPAWFPSNALLVGIVLFIAVAMIANRNLRFILDRADLRPGIIIGAGAFFVFGADSIPITSVPMEMWGVIGVVAIVAGVVMLTGVFE